MWEASVKNLYEMAHDQFSDQTRIHNVHIRGEPLGNFLRSFEHSTRKEEETTLQVVISSIKENGKDLDFVTTLCEKVDQPYMPKKKALKPRKKITYRKNKSVLEDSFRAAVGATELVNVRLVLQLKDAVFLYDQQLNDLINLLESLTMTVISHSARTNVNNMIVEAKTSYY
ncbi:hypothetical protein CAPTEDRAFT_216382 [Capitella teleta]|uniref:Uncharacterized protein n=1 Tax=Capitella teleta TaxID=283909 RepID=R7U9M3_CAPTE|nr:hypothetical protein CAPTEDRAFT_216382 [Capitella teleta]|eukprot:ELT99800.1 hypothetical protein CAPTEDRAFT_216382 [Capitella teleta]